MKTSKIYITNRTKEKAENLKNLFKDLEVIDWGILPDFDVIINATSLGLKGGIDFNFNLSDSLLFLFSFKAQQ